MNKPCDEIKLSLPWLVAGTLEGTELFYTLDHVRTCASCRNELAFFTVLSHAANNVLSPSPNPKLWNQVLKKVHTQADQLVNLPQAQHPVITSILLNKSTPLGIIGTVLDMVKEACMNPIARAAWSCLALKSSN